MNWCSGAAVYAAEANRDDLRKGTAIPYLSHLWSVAALVPEHGGDDWQVAAALLHDVVEDHGVVDTTAGEAKPPWRSRKEACIAHLADADDRVLLVSTCDKLHNDAVGGLVAGR